jgi:prophage antirepressor-like protein
MSLALVPNQSSPQHFVFAGKNLIRVIDRDGEAWFIAADVCAALGLIDVSRFVSRLDDDEKGTTTTRTPGGDQTVLIVNEPGLYSLILTSRKPEAKAFKRWITHEVLPAIRKTGSYIAPAAARMTEMEVLLAVVQRMVDNERQIAELKQGHTEHDQRLSDIEVRQTAIEQGSRYFTVVGFAIRISHRLTNEKAQSLGKHATRYSNKHGYPVGKSPDTRYGKVNTYHEDVLRAVFGLPAE